ncbi:hypothetical protein ANRL3_00353 [Anaerolineae bacterium]|nr:hypothetical protein ANRL3_00353 [Anaerolineae bacterium]
MAAKINRGSFSFLFFMQGMKALGREMIRLEDNQCNLKCKTGTCGKVETMLTGRTSWNIRLE